MQETGEELVRRLHAEAIERYRQQGSPAPLAPRERPTIHWTELPEEAADSSIATEWRCFRREVGRLLEEGHEGKWVLIKDEQIIGIYETFRGAREIALQKYLGQSVLIQQVRSREPILRVRASSVSIDCDRVGRG
jgi:hypothetical protein